ncbi:MAG: 5-formyltetrahydrofolate cyclo-ligase, partial [Candidatus Riflemargulisbacteria bacterium]
MDKKGLREKLLAQRRSLPALEVEHRSKIIINKLIEYIESLDYTSVAAYFPIHNEVDLRPFYDYVWKKNKNLLLPYAFKNGDMEFKLFEQKGFLKKDDYGIPSPNTTSIFP